MIRLTKLLLLLTALSASAQTTKSLVVLPYFSYSTYANAAQKQSAIISGLYGYYGIGLTHTIEADVNYSRIHYGNNPSRMHDLILRTNHFDIKQADLTLAYTNYRIKNLKLRLGMHTIFTDDPFTDKAAVLWAGVHRFVTNQYHAGIDLYQSFYPNYIPDLQVTQANATFGFYSGNYFRGGQLYFRTRGTYIRLNKEVGYTDTEYASVQQTVSYYKGKIRIAGFFWTGYRVFAVDNDGFAVFNLPERHIGALGSSVTYETSLKSRLTLTLSEGRLKELGIDRVVKYWNLTLAAGYNF